MAAAGSVRFSRARAVKPSARAIKSRAAQKTWLAHSCDAYAPDPASLSGKCATCGAGKGDHSGGALAASSTGAAARK